MTHVFVVNETTFNIHLQYMFAGTGFAEYEPDLLSLSEEKYAQENTLTGMIADISKVREGDSVIFYVTGCKKFFGIFKIASSPFFESKDANYLGASLGKYLPFRVMIEPDTVYAQGISEQIALDDISTINKPYEMCWSMIYRKLTGMRGCSFLMDYEVPRIKALLSEINGGDCLTGTDFYYDKESSRIAVAPRQIYSGAVDNSLSIDNRLYNIKGAHEGHVQAYITQNIGNDPQLTSKLLPPTYIKKWIGNEVVCSVGEKRIDILTIVETDDEIQVRIIELKDEYPKADIVNYQIPWYIKWVDQYVVPNLVSDDKSIKIIPTIFSYPYKRNTKNKRLFDAAVSNFNSLTAEMCTNATVSDIDCIYYDRTCNPIKIY